MYDERRARFTQDLLDEIRRLRDQTGGAQPSAGGLPANPLVLVVDDDAASTMALQALLAIEGFEVDTAANGAQALQCIARRKPCVVLTDMRMPEMDGAELCRRLAHDPETRDIPVFVITGHEPAAAGALPHAKGVLRKPVDTDLVISLLRTRTS